MAAIITDAGDRASAEGRYTGLAVRAVTQAARTEHDFAGWLAQVLATVAGQLGSGDALIAGRPGSWEAELAHQLVSGMVGYDDEGLPPPRGSSPTRRSG